MTRQRTERQLRTLPSMTPSMRQRALSAAPWVVAGLGLAVPMVGSGFIGWPLVVGWIVLLVLVWRIRPFGNADRATRLVFITRDFTRTAAMNSLREIFGETTQVAYSA